jgi:catechol 2,3-dioxygenase-like lactoylglutathione lyase family enzyme
MQPDLNQIDLVVHDMDATIAFYRALGVEISEAAIWRTPSGIHHVDIRMPGGLIVHFDSPRLAAVYDRGWREPDGRGTRSVLSFQGRRARGGRSDLRTADRPRIRGFAAALRRGSGARAMRFVEDPDGNHIGS